MYGNENFCTYNFGNISDNFPRTYFLQVGVLCQRVCILQFLSWLANCSLKSLCWSSPLSASSAWEGLTLQAHQLLDSSFFLILTDFNYKKTQHLTKVSILMFLLAINAELLNRFLCEFLLPVINLFHYIIFKLSQCLFLISSLKAEALLVQYVP